MSAETFTTALFLITAIVAASVLINAVFPVVYTMSGTFQSATHESDVRIRTDFKIVAAYPNTTPVARLYDSDIFMKNIGSQRIPVVDIQRSDVICGPVGTYGRLSHGTGDNQWTYNLFDLNSNGYWDTGETIAIYAMRPKVGGETADTVYFQFILPNGIWRSIEFPAVS